MSISHTLLVLSTAVSLFSSGSLVLAKPYDFGSGGSSSPAGSSSSSSSSSAPPQYPTVVPTSSFNSSYYAPYNYSLPLNSSSSSGIPSSTVNTTSTPPYPTNPNANSSSNSSAPSSSEGNATTSAPTNLPTYPWVTMTSSSSSGSLPPALPSATPTPYIIIPSVYASQGQMDSFTGLLVAGLGAGSVQTTTALDGITILFWYAANLSEDLVNDYTTNPVVGAVIPDWQVYEPSYALPERRGLANRDGSGKRNRRRDAGEIQTAESAPQDLVVVSQPDGVPLAQLDEYKYSLPAGEGVTVYTLGSGLNQGHPEFNIPESRIRWIFTGEDTTTDDVLGHGSCVASKVLGARCGVAKNANLVAVKVQSGPEAWVSGVLRGLALVAKDIAEGNSAGGAVVLVSLTYTTPTTGGYEFWALSSQIFGQLFDHGAVVVTGSGDVDGTQDQESLEMTTYPSILTGDFPIITVGSVDFEGAESVFSQGGSQLTVLAPGEQITCARGTGEGFMSVLGTSFAASIVAGLAAYFMSLNADLLQTYEGPSTAEAVREILQKYAYPRLEGGQPVVWNAVN